MSSIIWLASYPKSGNTWVRAFLQNYLDAGDRPSDINAMDRYFADESKPNWYAPHVQGSLGELDLAGICALRPQVQRDIAASRHGTIFVKTHNFLGAYQDLPLHEMSVTAGAVYIVRNPLYVSFFFILAPIAAKLLSFAIHHFHQLSEEPGFIPIALVALILAFAALAHYVGAPELLGGFAAGIALSRRFFLPLGLTLQVSPGFNRRMHKRMRPIIQLFTPIFFVMVGLSLDLSAVDWSSPFIWVFSIVVTVVAIVGKLAGGLLVPENHYTRVAMGMAMVPRGEVGLIFAELGRISGIFSNEVYTGMVIVVAYTTLLSPVWIKLYYRIYGHKFEKSEPVAADTGSSGTS